MRRALANTAMIPRFTALVFGTVCQVSFTVAVVVMALGLHGEMRLGVASLDLKSFGLSMGWDLFLLLSFPLAHSVLLTTTGRRVLAAALPGELGRRLVSTTFVTLTSLQIICIFLFWSPLGAVSWHPDGWVLSLWEGVYWFSWGLLAVAMYQAGLGIQMGLLGWTSVIRGKEPRYPPMPKGWLYSVCRHPVYFAMAMVSVTGPVWTLDHLVIGGVFLAYCVVGPLFKERRFMRVFGEEFIEYKRSAPFFPTLRSVRSVLLPRR